MDIERRNIPESLRVPILQAESHEDLRGHSERFREWNLISESIRQEILTDSHVHSATEQFISAPVDEHLARDFMTAMRETGNERIGRLLDRYDETLGVYSRLEAVPEHVLNPDISHAFPYLAPGASNVHPAGWDGVTDEERQLVHHRYLFARDVKRLALGAFLATEPEIPCVENGKLENGIVYGAAPEKISELTVLMNPNEWTRRKQIKDRVYEIEAGGVKYIIKEKKTSWHLHTDRNGYPTRTSREEFEIARKFEKAGTTQRDDVVVRWEKPVAYVAFPDGYSFVVFEYEDDLTKNEPVELQLAKGIEGLEESYRDEYEYIKNLADLIWKRPDIFSFVFKHPEWSKHKQEPALTFKLFARVKSDVMLLESELLERETSMRQGYSNADKEGFALRVSVRDQRMLLERIGFDFEYFTQGVSEDLEKRIQEMRKFTVIHEMRNLETCGNPREYVLLYLAFLTRIFPDYDNVVERKNPGIEIGMY